ncbi:penicillin binding protein PBP4B [Thalassotalea sp. PP2-459]|uniref:penicillin binding protein PBP4B n=1 Tax=Thalassotalea sp. PP2-459 TaxID=1742724 RepID=UPI000944FD1D|nr:penicillin binding protein PBP4B [Thalassotalea sp. PP2-459]OKY25197.1 N-acetylmuramoyl-L-alanine amidase [Thalassotalea sp. PP2-459]
MLVSYFKNNLLSPYKKPTALTALMATYLLFLSSCSSLSIEELPSENYSKRIKFLVMHYTAINYERSVTALVDKGGVSSHYLLPERLDNTYDHSDLNIYRLVDEQDRAWHAGSSYWQGRRDLNDHSIGIEIVNVPECKRTENKALIGRSSDSRNCIFPDYDPEQIQLLIKLSKDILARNPDIGPTQVVGHADIAPARKTDPGPRFPWYQLYKAGIGAWYEKSDMDQYWQIFQRDIPNIGLVQKALNRYGYGIIETGILDSNTIDTLTAFQMHFIPWNINGKADAKTVATLFALLKKYKPNKLEALWQRYQFELQPVIEPVYRAKRGQIDRVFPDAEEKRSKRELVNDRAIFKAYKGRGEIIIDSMNATSADIYINGQKISIASPMVAGNRYQYSLARRTKNGDNTLRVENVIPEGATINIVIPYPTLVDKSMNKNAKNLKSFSAVDKQITDDIEQGFPGAALLVIKDGNIIKHQAYGYARKFADGGELLAQPVKMQKNTIFDIASNTKMFATNFALMTLAEEGRLDVTKPLSYYLPDYSGGGRDSRLVKDFLTHTAGYAPQVRFFTKENKLGESFYSQHHKKTKQLILNNVPFVVGRNTKHMYSDTDFMLLGMLIERITGQSLDVYVEQHIYQQLGLTDTLFNPLDKGKYKQQFAATEVHGTTRGGRVDFSNVRKYVLQGEVHDEKAFHSFNGVAGHAGLFSTTLEIGVLMQTLLNGGGYGDKHFFNQRILDQFTKPDDSDGSFGLGWRRSNNGALKWHFGPYASSSAYGHTGWTGTVTVIDPEHDLAIVLLTNARHTLIEGDEKHYSFKGKQFETGKYGSIISLIYEEVLHSM